MGFLYALVAVGLTIIWGLMEMINFAHGEFLMLGMFGAWWASVAFRPRPAGGARPGGARDVRARRAGLPAAHAACPAGRPLHADLRDRRPPLPPPELRRRGLHERLPLPLQHAAHPAQRREPPHPRHHRRRPAPDRRAPGARAVPRALPPDRPDRVRAGPPGDGGGPRGGDARRHPTAEDVRRRLGPRRRAGRRRRDYPRELLRRLPPGGLSVHRPRLRHRRARRVRLHPRHTSGRAPGRRGPERHDRVPPARLQGRVRLRVLYRDRPLPTPGALWPVLADGAGRESSSPSVSSWVSCIRSPSSGAATPISRPSASWS